MNKKSKIVIFGSRGLVGSALCRLLKSEGYENIIESHRGDLDLMRQAEVEAFFEKQKPEYVFMCAAKVGGIKANNEKRADFIYENITIQSNIFGSAHKFPVKRLLFLASNCIYPKDTPGVMKEEMLLTAPLEPTNEPYAVAKIAGIKTAESFKRQYGHDFISILPTSLYGPGDNYDPESSHVVAGLIARMTLARDNHDDVFTAWGSGKPQRELMFVDDLADACLFLMNYAGELPAFLNAGSAHEVTIQNLVELIKKEVGFSGKIEFDTSKPDGIMRKLLDSSKINELGWKAQTNLEEGFKKTVESYQAK